jgi:uncharacterized FAD-dependent dehydrogenase
MVTDITISLTPKEKDDSNVWRKKIVATLKDMKSLDLEISSIKIIRQSLDARSRNPFYQTIFRVYTKPHIAPSPVPVISTGKRSHSLKNIVIIGAGPAGLFAAITLVENGYTPIILEQGKKVEERKKDIVLLQRNGILNPLSNYCFGEGGAGCFSDGKLYTRSNKRGDIEKILRTFVFFGASDKILYEAHPHIGSDKLPAIIASMRKWLEQNGCIFHFNTEVIDFVVKDGLCREVITHTQTFPCDKVILATGHSSNKIYKWFYSKGYTLEQKPFALGVRVEHPQELINRLQYGQHTNLSELPPAEYRFAEQIGERGVFSFCMCPGGVLVPSMTEQQTLVLNGMSASARSSAWANSGMVATISPSDYGNIDAIAGLLYRDNLERKFFEASGKDNFQSPAQRITDFLQNRKSQTLPRSSYPLGIYESELNKLLPVAVTNALQEGFRKIDRKRKGYITNEAIITGIESRTSSPVRILRNNGTLSHPQITNLYPCGEGAGYAGGITSSAIDGVNVGRKTSTS